MKRVICVALILLGAIAFPADVFSQARKPKLMIVPSDIYCARKGFTQTFEVNGQKRVVGDYQRLLQNDADARLVISKINNMFIDRGFPLGDLEASLKGIESDAAMISVITDEPSGSGIKESPLDRLKSTVKPDIVLDLDFELKQQGPKKYVVFNLKGIDAYSDKNIAGASGAGAPSFSPTVEVLLEEAVVSHMNDFTRRLQSHFDEMFTLGREVKFRVQVWNDSPINLDEEFAYKGDTGYLLSEIIEFWFTDNTVEGRFTISDGTSNFMIIDQVRIPLFDKSERPMDATNFANSLRRFLSAPPYNVQVKVQRMGLGEAWVIIQGNK
ncbi:MAG: DUF6175 family protein [Bacteroidia bacterium]|nr:DUF6175 family protein [Bacteroidia bacterium]